MVLGDEDGPTSASYVTDLEAVVSQVDLTLIDIPIGLPASGRRAVDKAAKELLHAKKKSCVFPVSNREVMEQPTYSEANALAERLGLAKISYQLFNLAPKILEVDRLLRGSPELVSRVLETHPELGFAVMADSETAMPKKKSAEGMTLRQQMLEEKWPSAQLGDMWESVKSSPAVQDDFWDACVAFWSAQRHARGEALCIPETSEVDEFGLPVQMIL